MILDDCFCAFVNMDHRTDRLEHMNGQLARIGLNAERTRGIKPSEYRGDPAKVRTMMKRTPGAVGCHASQVRLMKEALKRKQHAFVMEDDIIFCQDFNERMILITEFLDGREWDVFWLGGTFHSPAYWHPVGKSKMAPNCSANLGKDCEVVEGRFMRTYGAFCTYAYIVNVNSLNKIFRMFQGNIDSSIGIDWLFIKLQPQLNTFAFVPGSVKQMDNQSDIGDGITRFSGFSKLNGTIENSRYWYQERMEDFDHTNFKWQ